MTGYLEPLPGAKRRGRRSQRRQGKKPYRCGCCHPLDTDGREFVQPRTTRERRALRDQGAV